MLETFIFTFIVIFFTSLSILIAVDMEIIVRRIFIFSATGVAICAILLTAQTYSDWRVDEATQVKVIEFTKGEQ